MELHVKKGKHLYRTPSSNTEAGIFGNFYSTKEVAKKYISGKSLAFEGSLNKVYTFKVRHSLKLLDLSDIKSFEFLDKKFKDTNYYTEFQQFTGYGLKTLHLIYTFKDPSKKSLDACYYRNKKKYEPVICDYLEDLDNPNDYLHMKLAKQICTFGYDGYYIPTKYLYANFFNMYSESELDPYFDTEYFICEPKSSLELIV
jgi:hypothetical protein